MVGLTRLGTWIGRGGVDGGQGGGPCLCNIVTSSKNAPSSHARSPERSVLAPFVVGPGAPNVANIVTIDVTSGYFPLYEA